MQFTKRHKAVAALGAGAVAVAGSGVAFAYWTSTGGGTDVAPVGTTTAGSLQAWDTTSTPGGGTPLTNLRPGLGYQQVSGTIKNNEAHASVVVRSVTLAVQVDKATDAPAGPCDPTDYQLLWSDGQVRTSTGTPATTDADGNPVPASNVVTLDLTANVSIPAGQTAPFGYQIRFNNKGTNQDGCKGAAVSMHYVVNAP